MYPFVQRHQEKIAGVLTCFDRVVITGTLPEICHAGALVGYLSQRDILLRDYQHWAQPFRDELRSHAEHPGLVHIFSAMEACASFKPWDDKAIQRNTLKPTQGKCLHC